MSYKNIEVEKPEKFERPFKNFTQKLIETATIDRALRQQKEKLETCTMCNGTGEVTINAQIYNNEPHRASIDSQDCLCTSEVEE